MKNHQKHYKTFSHNILYYYLKNVLEQNTKFVCKVSNKIHQMNNSSVSINTETVDKPDKYKPGKLLFGYEFNAKKTGKFIG